MNETGEINGNNDINENNVLYPVSSIMFFNGNNESNEINDNNGPYFS